MLLVDTPYLRLATAPPAAEIVDGDGRCEIWRPTTPAQCCQRSWPHRVLGHLAAQCETFQRADGLLLERRIAAVPHGILIHARLHNGTRHPLRVRSIDPLVQEPGGLQLAGDPAAWWPLYHKDTPAVSCAERLPSRAERVRAMWRAFGCDEPPFPIPTEPCWQDGRWRSFRDWMTLFRAPERAGLVIAAIDTCCDADIDCFIDPDAGHALRLGSACSDCLLLPGGTRPGGDLLLLGGDYDAVVPSAFSAMGQACGARRQRPPLVGWCSWYDRRRDADQDHIAAVSDRLAELRERIPMDVIQIDDAWQQQLGAWLPNERFPDGWPPLIDRIRAAGASPGVWVAPLLVSSEVGRLALGGSGASLVERHPDWFQRGTDGAPVVDGDGWGDRHHLLDPSHPAARGWLMRELARLRDAGFDYVKIDFNSFSEPRGWIPHHIRWHDATRTRLEIYRDTWRCYRQALGESCYLLACTCEVLRGPIGFCDAIRNGPDSDATWLKANRCCLRDCFQAVAATAGIGDRLGVLDPDVSYWRPRQDMDAALLQAWHATVGLLGGAVFVSEPVTDAAYRDDETLRMQEILHPPAPEQAGNLAAGTDPDGRAFGFVAERPWGRWAVVRLFNPGDGPARIGLPTALHELIADGAEAWSFWDRRSLGRVDPDWPGIELAARSGVLLRLTPTATVPTLIGSDLHIACGAAEIADWRWDGHRLTIVLTDAGARSGQLLIRSRERLALAHHRGCRAEVALQSADTLLVSIAERARGADQVIELATSPADR